MPRLEEVGINIDEDLISLSVSEQPLQTVLSNLQTGKKLAAGDPHGGSLAHDRRDPQRSPDDGGLRRVRDLCRSDDEAYAAGRRHSVPDGRSLGRG